MIMSIGFCDRKPHRNDIKKRWLRRGLRAAEIRAHMEDELVGSDMKGVARQKRSIGASIRIGAGFHDGAPCVAFDGEQLALDTARRSPLTIACRG